MNISDAITSRRSVKFFDPDFAIDENTFESLINLMQYSPTAFNLQHYRLVRITDSALRTQLRAAAWDQPQLTDASEILIFCFDSKTWEKDPARVWEKAPADIQALLVPEITGFYQGRDAFQIDEGHRSCAFAAQTLMLAARNFGLDSCPLDGFDFETAAKLINLPDDHRISFIIALGKQLKAPHSHPGRLNINEFVVENSF